MKGLVHALVATAALLACSSSSTNDDPGGTSTDAGAVKRIFVTSLVYNGNLKLAGNAATGLEGADALCNQHGQKLGGTWVAWISTTVGAYDRVTGEGPWYRVDGATQLFPTRDSLKGTPLAPIATDEDGLDHATNVFAWTGTDLGGTPAANLQRCTGWIIGIPPAAGQSGDINSAGPEWTHASLPDPCGAQNRLICIEL